MPIPLLQDAPVSDLDQISAICQEYEALLHSDTVQTLGKFELDLSKTRIGFLSGSGHKIFGPKGAGIIYINHDCKIQSLIKGGGQERALRSGTENIYGIVGFARAFEWLTESRDSFYKKTTDLRNHFKAVLREKIPDIQFNGNQEHHFIPNVLSISLPKTDKTEMVIFSLDIEGICASSGSACSSGSERGSHVMEAINLDKSKKAVRFSFSHHTTMDELTYTAEKLSEIVYD